MSYTTVTQVAGMFPTFVRGTPQQKPSDTLIQTYIDDVAAEIDAILQRRGFSGQTPFSAWVASLSVDALNLVEIINRYGAAAQLGDTLAAFGVAGARELAKSLDEQFADKRNALDARDRNGKPLSSGPYDKLFDLQARTETSEPALQAIAGADQPVDQTPADTGSSAVFGKFDKRGT